MIWLLGDGKKHLKVEAICASDGTSFGLQDRITCVSRRPLLALYSLVRSPVESTAQLTPTHMVPGS